MRKMLVCFTLAALAGCAHQPAAEPMATGLAQPTPVRDWVRCDIVFDNAGGGLSSGYAQLVGVPVADTVDKQTRGLSGELTPGNPMMLFTWATAQRRATWMNGVHIPLSVAYLDQHGTVTEIHDMEPDTNAFHWSAAPVLAALEAGQGTFQAKGIHVGSRMDVQQCNGPVVYPPLTTRPPYRVRRSAS